MLPPRGLPKKGLPLLEIAVALVACLLGGFGTVAMCCTLGVYVQSVKWPFDRAQLLVFGARMSRSL